MEYLDLSILDTSKIKISEDRTYKLKCNFENYSHELHSDHKQLNTLIDLIINLSLSLEKDKNNISTLFKFFQDSQTKIEKKLNQIINNQDFIKDQTSSSTTIPVKALTTELENIKSEIKSIKTIVNELKYL